MFVEITTMHGINKTDLYDVKRIYRYVIIVADLKMFDKWGTWQFSKLKQALFE